MPGVIDSSPPFPADAFQMAKTDDKFHFAYLHSFYRAGFTLPGRAAVLRTTSHLSFAPHGSNFSPVQLIV
jgi:hypothetical protein